MAMMQHDARTTDGYIRIFPPPTQSLLLQLRAAIRRAVPKETTETIAYGMAAFRLGGPLVYFGGFKQHVGFFPGAAGVAAFSKELKKFKTSKGTIQFPLGRPVPMALVRKIVKYRVEQNLALPKLAAPAQRALGKARVKNLLDLSKLPKAKVARLHGMGPSALKTLTAEMRRRGLKFKKA